MKLLYEVVSKNDGYVEKLIGEYEKILDFYIQEAVIFVLSQIKKECKSAAEFYNKIINKPRKINRKAFVELLIFGPHIHLLRGSRKDLYKFDYNAGSLIF